MADSVPPSKSDIQAIFKRLRSTSTNKQCFDCASANPTWASVTYGVFLCIDCSATHRGLGVHLTFIRSTQLDTNWTWVQLRAMQCGGNANATAFFRQHGCSSKDSQQKYNSRAAAMYKEKLHQSALHAQRLYGEKVHIDVSDTTENTSTTQEEDFFKNHTSGEPRGVTEIRSAATPPRVNSGSKLNTMTSTDSSGSLTALAVDTEDSGQPSVDAALVSPKQTTEPRKSTIGQRKPGAKKGLGGKGLGASRVKANFSEIEAEAQRKDKAREDSIKSMATQETRSAEEAEKQFASMKLAYKDIAADKKKHADRLRSMDPKKAEQAERLGMGYGSSRGISHSAISDMTVITQGNTTSKPSSNQYNTNLDDWEKVSAPSNSLLYDDLGRRSDTNTSSGTAGWSSSWDNGGNSWGKSSSTTDTSSSFFNDELMTSKTNKDETRTDRSRRSKPNTSTEEKSDSDFQTKYANAKSISSSQVHGDNDRGSELDSSRFSGSASISSDDYFGTGNKQSSSYNSINAPDLQDIKDGVKHGVTKVAGKLSNIASGVMSSLQ